MENCLFWFRRDLRLDDNAGLHAALSSGKQVQCLFVFDSLILDPLQDRDDARVNFIYQTVYELAAKLEHLGGALWTIYGNPVEVVPKLTRDHDFSAVYANHDYEPYAKERDSKIALALQAQNKRLYTYKDQCILEKDEVLKSDGKPYTVFTPYKRRWLEQANSFQLKAYPSEKYWSNFRLTSANEYPPPSLASMRFTRSSIPFPSPTGYESLLAGYSEKRNFPGVNATSRMSVHLRFGTVSIRRLASQAAGESESWLNELIWRDFYFSILWHFPYVVGHAFRPEYDRIPFRNDPDQFAAWCEGKTGFPLVDAGMRELLATGFMHNRVRMVVASFLIKDLLIDWRLGEAYFARKLLDFELSSNNGGWQWAAGSGVDAAPFFRIFNPSEQVKKFDRGLEYVKKWVPELSDFSYPEPIVDHAEARTRCLKVYREALGETSGI